LIANLASALRVENTHTTSGTIDKFFDVTVNTTVTLQVKAPETGSIAAAILKYDGGEYEAVDQISRNNGLCGSKTVNLEANDNSYCLNSIAGITTGEAHACAFTSGQVNCCATTGS